MSVIKEIKVLENLQVVDREIDRLEKLEEKIPGQIEKEERSLAKMEEQLEELKQQRLDLIKRRDSKEVDVEDYEAKIEKKKGDRFKVSKQENFDKINERIENLKNRVEECSEQYLVLDDESEQVEEEIRKLTVDLQEAQGEVDQFVSERKAQLKKTRGKIAKLEEKRKELKQVVEEVDEALLKKYEKLMKQKFPALVPIVEQVCGGCYARIPAQRINEVRELYKIHHCESCGRMLYWKEEKGES